MDRRAETEARLREAATQEEEARRLLSAAEARLKEAEVLRVRETQLVAAEARRHEADARLHDAEMAYEARRRVEAEYDSAQASRQYRAWEATKGGRLT